MTRPTRKPQAVQNQVPGQPSSNGAEHRPAPGMTDAEPQQQEQPDRYKGWGYLLILWLVAFALLAIWELWGFISRMF